MAWGTRAFVPLPALDLARAPGFSAAVARPLLAHDSPTGHSDSGVGGLGQFAVTFTDVHLGQPETYRFLGVERRSGLELADHRA